VGLEFGDWTRCRCRVYCRSRGVVRKRVPSDQICRVIRMLEMFRIFVGLCLEERKFAGPITFMLIERR
jgi:hypothetical protein